MRKITNGNIRTSPVLPNRKRLNGFRRDIFLYILLLPSVILTFVFAYLPMPGILAAFKDYNMLAGLWKSPWAGMKHIQEIFELPLLTNAIWNTLKLSVLTLIVGFPAPIVLALLINEIKNGLFKRSVQTISYLPHFLSWISVVGLAYALLDVYGPLNDLRIRLLGEETERIMFMSKQELFLPFLLLINVWKEVGWGTIVYLAAITSIDPVLYESAYMDGANRFQRHLYITLPGLKLTAVILLIFSLGGLFKSNFELVYGMQNAYIDFDVISTVVFSAGIQQGNYSMAAAVGFVEGLVAFMLIYISNHISRKLSQTSIW